ncbi:hypothetical protein Tco_0090192 [Tanacetum coccineum]
MSGMDDDLFSYEVEVANILCDSNKDDDSEQRVSHEADDDMGYDPSDIAFTKWLGDDEVELTNEESFDNEDEVFEVFRIDTNIFNFETPMCKTFKEFNYLLQIDPDLLTKDIKEFNTYEEYKDDWIHEWKRDIPWVDEKPWTDTDYEWCEALMDCELKEQDLRNKAILEGLISDDELRNDGWRRWDSHENTYHNHNELENETHDGKKRVMYKEYVAVKEDEYDDFGRTNDDA